MVAHGNRALGSGCRRYCLHSFDVRGWLQRNSVPQLGRQFSGRKKLTVRSVDVEKWTQRIEILFAVSLKR